MPTKEIHLIQAAQARPFIETAARLGAPVRSLARRAGMPLKEAQRGEGVIGERSLWKFVELAMQCPGCEQIGYLTALDHPVNRTGILGNMTITMASDLNSLLHTFTREVLSQSDGVQYKLATRKGQIWFVREIMFEDSAASWQAEQYVITFLIQIIRLCAPGDWLPRELRIASQKAPAPIPAEWCGIDILWGSTKTELMIERDILDLPPRQVLVDPAKPVRLDDSKGNRMLIQDIIDRQIWSRRVGLETAAAELGMSIATLKRRLAEMGATYTNLLTSRRVHHAIALLGESTLSVDEISCTLGYTSVSNFSRAFRKATGSTPSSLQISLTTDSAI